MYETGLQGKSSSNPNGQLGEQSDGGISIANGRIRRDEDIAD